MKSPYEWLHELWIHMNESGEMNTHEWVTNTYGWVTSHKNIQMSHKHIGMNQRVMNTNEWVMSDEHISKSHEHMWMNHESRKHMYESQAHRNESMSHEHMWMSHKHHVWMCGGSDVGTNTHDGYMNEACHTYLLLVRNTVAAKLLLQLKVLLHQYLSDCCVFLTIYMKNTAERQILWISVTVTVTPPNFITHVLFVV